MSENQEQPAFVDKSIRPTEAETRPLPGAAYDALVIGLVNPHESRVLESGPRLPTLGGTSAAYDRELMRTDIPRVYEYHVGFDLATADPNAVDHLGSMYPTHREYLLATKGMKVTTFIDGVSNPMLQVWHGNEKVACILAGQTPSQERDALLQNPGVKYYFNTLDEHFASVEAMLADNLIDPVVSATLRESLLNIPNKFGFKNVLPTRPEAQRMSRLKKVVAVVTGLALFGGLAATDHDMHNRLAASSNSVTNQAPHYATYLEESTSFVQVPHTPRVEVHHIHESMQHARTIDNTTDKITISKDGKTVTATLKDGGNPWQAATDVLKATQNKIPTSAEIATLVGKMGISNFDAQRLPNGTVLAIRNVQ